MNRRLLPYEHDLIHSLGVTEEEYFEFLAYQEQYADIKTGSSLDIRNDVLAVIAILTVVGVIFQVAAALTAPQARQASTPRAGAGVQNRDQVFAPRFGFNGFQEVARYGDPINLIYGSIKDNLQGGVRVKTSLVWSSVTSLGASQYMQLLTIIGASELEEVDFTRTAIDQLPVRTISSSVWQFYRANGGRMEYADLRDYPNKSLSGTQKIPQILEHEPIYNALSKNNKANPVYPYDLIVDPEDQNTVFGFSQAYSPSNNKVFSLAKVIPLFTKVYVRNTGGSSKSGELLVTLEDVGNTSYPLSQYWSSSGLSARKIPIGAEYKLRLALIPDPPYKKTEKEDIWKPLEAAQNFRREYAQSIDVSNTWKLGTAIFETLTIEGDDELTTDMIVRLRCIRAGFGPTVPSVVLERNLYGTESATELATKLAFYQAERTKAVARRKSYAVNSQPYIDEDEIVKEYNEIIKETREQINDKNAQNYSLGYYTKCLASINRAAYETISYPDTIEFAIRARVYRKINGRAYKYGTAGVTAAGFNVNQNGTKYRTAFFRLTYQRVKPDGNADENFITYPGIFAVRRAATNDNYVSLKIKLPQGTTDVIDNADNYAPPSTTANPSKATGSQRTQWRFSLEPVVDIVAEVRGEDTSASSVYIYYLENNGNYKENIETVNGLSMTVFWKGKKQVVSTINQNTGLPDLINSGYPKKNISPDGTNEWDLFNLATDTQTEFSYEGGAEFVVTAVTEQRIDFSINSRSSASSFPYYKNVALLGFNAYSGRNLQELRALSIYVTKGKKIKRINENTGAYTGLIEASSLAPEIFLDTITDEENGIGRYTRLEAVDLVKLGAAKRFCKANRLYMDGVIAETKNWREFWTETAPMSLLEMARINGRETLIPAVPFNAQTGLIDASQYQINCMFTAGNILIDSYKEEFLDYGSQTRDIIAEIVYRDTQTEDGFPRNRSITVRRKTAVETDSLRQTFDLSAFVTTQWQAILFGKLITNTRAHIKKAVEFKTFPMEAPIAPGSLCYVDVGHTSWDSLYTGSINDDGSLNLPFNVQIPNGTYKILFYSPGEAVLAPVDVDLSNNGATVFYSNTTKTLAGKAGYLFVLGTVVGNKRIFRITEISMDEEMEMTIKASEYPCVNGKALIAEGMTQSDWTGYHEVN